MSKDFSMDMVPHVKKACAVWHEDIKHLGAAEKESLFIDAMASNLQTNAWFKHQQEHSAYIGVQKGVVLMPPGDRSLAAWAGLKVDPSEPPMTAAERADLFRRLTTPIDEL